MPAIPSLKNFWNGGQDQDSAPEHIAVMDYVSAWNCRQAGTSSGEDGYTTNIESNLLIVGSLHIGINKVIGSYGFEQIRKGVFFIYNSFGFHQLAVLDYDNDTLTIVFENLTNSDGIDILQLTSQNYVLDIKLINDDYLIWNDANAPVGFTNLTTLEAGGYGTVLPEDFSLIKPQCLIPPTGIYGSDPGQPANYLFGLLPQFSVGYINPDFNYSTWSTWSKRIVPYQQNTPVLGSDVSQNNYIVVTVDIGSIRATTINISCRFGTDTFATIKTVNRVDVLALPNTSVDVSLEVYEAYDPATNLYSFVFYNNNVSIPVNPLETDLAFDYIWPCETTEVVNGDIIANAGIKAGYDRPSTPVTVGAVGYDPNIDIPAGTFPDPLVLVSSFKGATGSGAGDHKRTMYIQLAGTPHTGDRVIIILANIGNATATQNYTYTVPSGQDGNLAAVVQSIQESLPRSSYVHNGDGSYTINFIGDPFYGGQTFAVQLFFAGAAVANSIPTVLDNTTYQTARSYRDGYGRYFPLDTSNADIIQTPSFAQVNGNAVQIQWQILNPAAPIGAVDYQWLITVPPVDSLVDSLATPITYRGTWDAKTNMTTPLVGGGAALSVDDPNAIVGDAWQVTTPCSPADTSHYTNLGNSEDQNTGMYAIYNGQSYNFVPKEFGDLTPTGNILAFSLNPLLLFNSEYATQGVSTILGYQFSVGDRCTLHWYDGGNGSVATFTIVPGTGYTNGTYSGVALTGGTGTGAVADVVVAGGVVTTVTVTNGGTGYSVGDSLTGTVTGGTGWSVTVDTLTQQKIFINNPCVNLPVFGFDEATYIVKVEKIAATVFNESLLSGKNVFLRLYSPAPKVANENETVWYEIGDRYTITNGVHDTLSGVINDGGAYYKTRQFADGLKPYVNPPVDVLATDLNYSDFYPSAFWSNGRPRAFDDELEKAERKAIITWSESYVLGSKHNGLNRFYPENVYGTKGGETSANYGAIKKLLQVNNELVCIQELNHGSIPVYQTVYVDALQRTTVAVTEKLFNPIRYTTSKHIGVGNAKESIAIYNNVIYWIDPNRSQPVRWEGDGCFPISMKMTKYFKSTLQAAFASGLKIIGWYDIYNDEYVISIQQPGAIISIFNFSALNWQTLASYMIAPADITISTPPVHSTTSYDSGTGLVTITPVANYVGSDTLQISFPTGSGTLTKNACFAWTEGDTSVDPFSFAPQTGVPVSTEIQSNTIVVSGINVPVAISITGGQYSINGGSFTSAAGTVVNGDVIQVEVMSSGSTATATSTTLTISATTGTFTVTTTAPGNFTVNANYGYTITKVVGGTATGIPSGTYPVLPPNRMSMVYTSIGTGTVLITITGSPVFPNEQLDLYIGGALHSRTPVPSAGTYSVTIPSETDPTTILFVIDQL